MIVLAIVLGFIGSIGAMVSICWAVYIAYNKPKPEESLPDGTYRLKFAGRDKVTGASKYEMDEVVDETKTDEGDK